MKLTLPHATVEKCIQKAGISFMFAPAFHPAMKNIVPVRKALGVRTIFNILGPLLNPAECSRQLIGVYSEPMVKLMADVLHALGVEHSLVVFCGGEGLERGGTAGRWRPSGERRRRVATGRARAGQVDCAGDWLA